MQTLLKPLYDLCNYLYRKLQPIDLQKQKLSQNCIDLANCSLHCRVFLLYTIYVILKVFHRSTKSVTGKKIVCSHASHTTRHAICFEDIFSLFVCLIPFFSVPKQLSFQCHRLTSIMKLSFLKISSVFLTLLQNTRYCYPHLVKENQSSNKDKEEKM